MASVPALRGLTLEDFAEFSDQLPLLKKLLGPLNLAFQAYASAFKNGLTFRENVASSLRSGIACTTPASGSVLVSPASFSTGLTTSVAACLMWAATEANVTGVQTSGGAVTWSNSTDATGQRQVVVSGLGGLTASTDYLVSFLLLAG